MRLPWVDVVWLSRLEHERRGRRHGRRVRLGMLGPFPVVGYWRGCVWRWRFRLGRIEIRRRGQ